MIKLTNINKVYETKQGTIKAVDNVNLTIDNGDIFGIIGYSGAGKVFHYIDLSLVQK